jgi:hypothetical protein
VATSSARKRALDAIQVGDVIFGVGASGDGKLMLVYKADDRSIFARHVTTQTWVQFDREGKSRLIPTGGSCTIASTAQLPSDMHQVALGLDRKMRTAKQLSDLRLSKVEKTLLLTFDDFFKARPLPD